MSENIIVFTRATGRPKSITFLIPQDLKEALESRDELELKHHESTDYDNLCGYGVIGNFLCHLPYQDRLTAYKFLSEAKVFTGSERVRDDDKRIFPKEFPDENFVKIFEQFCLELESINLQIQRALSTSDHSPTLKINSQTFAVDLNVDLNKFRGNDTREITKILEFIEKKLKKTFNSQNYKACFGQLADIIVKEFNEGSKIVALKSPYFFQNYFGIRMKRFFSSSRDPEIFDVAKIISMLEATSSSVSTDFQSSASDTSNHLSSSKIGHEQIRAFFNFIFNKKYGFYGPQSYNLYANATYLRSDRCFLLHQKLARELGYEESRSLYPYVELEPGDDDGILFKKILLCFVDKFFNSTSIENKRVLHFFSDYMEEAIKKIGEELIIDKTICDTFPDRLDGIRRIIESVNKFFRNFHSFELQVLNLKNQIYLNYYLEGITIVNERVGSASCEHFSSYLPNNLTKFPDQNQTLLTTPDDLYSSAHSDKAISDTINRALKKLTKEPRQHGSKRPDDSEIDLEIETEFRPAIYSDREGRVNDNFRYQASPANQQLGSPEHQNQSPITKICNALKSANQLIYDGSNKDSNLSDQEMILAIFLAKKFGGIGNRIVNIKQYLNSNHDILPEPIPGQTDEFQAEKLIAKLRKFSHKFQQECMRSNVYSGNEKLTDANSKKFGLRLAFVPDEIFIYKVRQLDQSSPLRSHIARDLQTQIDHNKSSLNQEIEQPSGARAIRNASHSSLSTRSSAIKLGCS